MWIIWRAFLLLGLLRTCVHSLVSPQSGTQQIVRKHGRKAITTSTGVPIPVSVTTLRGGAIEAVFDLGRENLKLQSMATYSTITALVMNASLRLYTSQKFEIDVDEHGNRPKRVKTMESVFTASTILCIVSGMFTAVLFNILGIYSREALGMGNESGYMAFTAATAIYRKWGFRAFLTTCLSFVTSFVLSIVEKTSNEDRVGQYILIASIILLMFSVYHLQTVLALATKLIYTPEFKALHKIA